MNLIMRLPVILVPSLAMFMLGGCSMLRSAPEDIPPPPVLVRQPRLLQVPDDLRLPRLTSNSLAFSVPPAPEVQPAARPGPVVAIAPAPVAPPKAEDSQKLLFAPYMPTSSESSPPKTWVVDPSHDFPWIAGARPTRVNEETVLGVGNRMFGRMFAQVEFGTGALASPAEPKPAVVAAAAKQHKSGSLISRWFGTEGKSADPVIVPVASQPPSLHAAGVNCSGATCLDVARDMLLQDADRKGWKVLLNRRVSLHQSYQFQRDDRVIWLEVHSKGKNSLDLEYGLLPAQGGSK